MRNEKQIEIQIGRAFSLIADKRSRQGLVEQAAEGSDEYYNLLIQKLIELLSNQQASREFTVADVLSGFSMAEATHHRYLPQENLTNAQSQLRRLEREFREKYRIDSRKADEPFFSS